MCVLTITLTHTQSLLLPIIITAFHQTHQAGLFDGLGASEGGGGGGVGGGRRRVGRDSGGGEDEDYSAGDGPLGLRMVIDGSVAGQLIGKKGATINDIRTQSAARIQVGR